MLTLRANHRRLPRAPIRVPAKVKFGRQTQDAHVLQIGEGGLFLDLQDPLVPMTQLSVTFDLPKHGSHSSVVEVRWYIPKGSLRIALDAAGAGCRFLTVTSQTREAIAAYVKQTKQMYSQIQFALALSRPLPHVQGLIKDAKLDNFRDAQSLKQHVDLVLQQLNV